MDEHDHPEPHDLPPAAGPDPRRSRRRLALWGALAVVALGAGVVVVAQSGDDDDPQPLSLSLGAAGDASRATADEATGSAEPAIALASIEYVAGDDLPALGGEGDVYRIVPLTDAQLAELASAFGVDGEPVAEDGSTVVRSGTAEMRAYGPSWSYTSGRPYPGSDLGSAGTSSSTVGCKVQPDGREICEEVPAPAPLERPADLPTQDAAEAVALDALRTAGIDVDGAKVTSYDNIVTWSVTVDLPVDGRTAIGYQAYVTVASGGDILDASGTIGHLERVDSYPLISTQAAVDRLNETGGYSVYGSAADGAPRSAVGGDDAVSSSGSATPDTSATDDNVATEPDSGSGSSGSTGSAGATEPGAAGEDPPSDATIEPLPPEVIVDPVPETPIEPAEPTIVTLHSAEQALQVVWSWDGTEAYLVPSYVMDGTSDSGEAWTDVTTIAIDDDFLAPPPDAVDPETPATAVVDTPAEPEPAVDPAVTTDPGTPDEPTDTVPDSTIPDTTIPADE